MIEFQDLTPRGDMKDEIDDAIARVVKSGIYLDGVEATLFQKEFARYIEPGNYCVAVGNGFSAIYLSLLSAGVYTGEVLVPANAPMPVWKAVTMAGNGYSLHPVPVKPNLDTFNITLDEIMQRVTDSTKALILVHMFGCPVSEIADIRHYCARRGIVLIEDCSQAHGAVCGEGVKAGNFGDYAVFSFYPTKNLGAMGDAGAIIVKSEREAAQLRVMRAFGGGTNIGITSRMDEMQAAILRAKLLHLDEMNAVRSLHAGIYFGKLTGISGIILPKYDPGHVWHQFVIKVPDRRSKLMEELADRDIETDIHYLQFPPQTGFYYREDGRDRFETEAVEYLAKVSLSLPIAPHLSISNIEYVADYVKMLVKN
jgi:dTDP-4-amino-4,6-dideoxygalactose transaminase